MTDNWDNLEQAYIESQSLEPTWGEEAKGAALSLGIGLSRASKSLLVDTPNMVGNILNDDFGGSQASKELNQASNFFQEGIDAMQNAKPYRVRRAESQQIIDDEGNFHMPNSSQIMNTIIEAIPQMAAYLNAGRAGSGIAGLIGKTDKARKIGEVAGFGVGGGLLGGSETFGETRAEALGIIKQSTNPETGQPWSDDEANRLATAVATEAGANQVPVSALLGAVGLGTASLVKGGIASRIAKGSAVDIAPESAEEGFQTYFGGKAIHDNLDSSRDPFRGVLNNAALGGIVGGTQGGITAAIDRGNSVDLLNDREVTPDESKPQQSQQEQPQQPGTGFTMEGGPTITPQHQRRRERPVVDGDYIPRGEVAPTSLAALANPNPAPNFTLEGEPVVTPQHQQRRSAGPSPALQYIDQMPDETIQVIADGVPDGMTPEQFLAQQGMPQDAVIAIMERMSALPSQQLGPMQSSINSLPPLDSEAVPIVPDTQPIVEQSAPVVEAPVQVEGDSLLATGSNISADLVKAREFAEHLASKGKITPENLSDLQEYWGDADKLSGAIKSLRSVKPNRKSKYWRSSSSNTGEPVIPENIRKEIPPEINLKTDQIKELSDLSSGMVGELSLPTMKQLVGMRGKIQRISGDENVFRNGADWVDIGDGYSAIAYQKGDKVVRAFKTPDGSVGVQSLDGDGKLSGDLIGESKPFIVEQGVDKTGLASEQITQHSKSPVPKSVRKAVSKSTAKAEGAPKTKVAAALPKGTIQGGAKEINRLVKVAKLGPGNKKTAVSFSSVGKKQAEKIKDAIGEDVEGYRHVIDSFGVRHSIKHHGNAKKEEARGQLAITDADFAKIPEIVQSPDSIESAGKDRTGNPLIRYKKRFNGTTYYVEEVRKKRGELVSKTLWKTRTAPSATSEKGVSHTSETLSRNSPQLDNSVTPAKSDSKKTKTSKNTKTSQSSRKKRAATVLGASVGDIIKPSKDFDYLTGGREYTVERIDTSGETHFVSSEGGRTSIRLPVLNNAPKQGVKFERVAADQDEKPKDNFVDKPKFSRESDGVKQKDKPPEKPLKKDSDPSFSRSSSLGNGPVNSKNSPVKEVSFTGVDAIKRAVTRIASGLGLDPSIVVTVNTEADLPSAIRDAIERDGAHGQIRAVFHAGKVYLVAEKIKSSHDVLNSLLHEFGHLGARKLFGDDIGIAYRQLWMKLGGTQGILKQLKSLGLDGMIKPYMETAKGLEPEHRMLLLVDEFIAIANQDGVNQTLSAKVARAIKEFIGKVRSLLEAKGIIQPKEFTASDLAYLLKQVNNASRIKRSIGDIRKARKDVRFSRVDVSAETTQRFEEAIDTHGSTILDSLKKGASQSSDKFKASSLAVLTLRQLTDIGSKYFPQKMKGYLDTIHRMIAERNSDIEESHKVAKRWQKWAAKNKAQNEKLVDLMHEATIRGVDPSWTQEQLRDFIKSKIIADENLVGEDMPTELSEITRWLEDRIGVEEEKARGRSGDGTTKFMKRAESYKRALKQIPQLSRDYAKLRARYSPLSKEAKALFNDVRDSYQAKSDKLLDILEDRIDRAELDEAVLREMLAKLKKDFESNRLQGPYFPLARFGEFWVSAVDPDGERVFLMYETEAQAKKAATNLNEQGFDAQWGAKLESSPLTDNVSLQFINEVLTKTDDGNLPPGIKDEIYQLYLQSLPDRSLRKQFIHRKKVAGYSNDAIRAFASASIKSSYQMARLKNIDDLNDYLSEMKSATKIQDGNQGVRARLYNEMLKRHEWVMKPGNSQLSNKITGLGFVYMLGLTPAAALINTTQNMVVAFPVLASRYGPVAAAKELVKASSQFMKSGKYVSKAARLKAQREGKDAELLSIRDSLTGEEKKAYDELVELGAIDVTMSHDLAGIAENDSTNYDDKWHKVMSVVSYGFHKAEVYNRESTGMAAYRLARQGGQTHRQAINYAADVIWDAHFDYSSVNRARVMQGDWMKVATQFKQYSQNMTYYLWRNMYQSMKGESADVKREARRQLLGTLGMTAILGGISIMPALSVVYGIAEIAVAGWDDWDDDNEEPFDAEAEFKQWFAEQVGEEPANWILNGVGGKSLGSRISLNDLWFRDPQREITHASELWTHYASQAAGPVFGGVVMNWLLAGQRMKEGEYYRGLEYMMPKAVKDLMKTYRYANDGAESRVGTYKEDFTALELFGQSIGFTPSDLLMTYEKNNVTKQYERKILNHRSGLLYEYFRAWESKDKEANSEVMERIRSFNKKYPEIAIKQSTIMRSVKGRLRSRNESQDGILVSKRLRERLVN